MDSFTLTAKTRWYPTLSYHAIKEDILGSEYSLSLSFVGEKRAKALNRTYRQRSYVPNVLSFPLNATTGEIVICPQVAKREAANFAMTPINYIGFLFIHGCLHLKGLDHGATMEKAERRYCLKYKLS